MCVCFPNSPYLLLWVFLFLFLFCLSHLPPFQMAIWEHAFVFIHWCFRGTESVILISQNYLIPLTDDAGEDSDKVKSLRKKIFGHKKWKKKKKVKFLDLPFHSCLNILSTFLSQLLYVAALSPEVSVTIKIWYNVYNFYYILLPLWIFPQSSPTWPWLCLLTQH